MKNWRLTLLALPIVLGAAACGGGGDEGPVDGSTGGAPPLASCSSDSNCGASAGCVANHCVQRRSDIGKWAFEIDPPAGSGSQLTEIPAAGNKTASLTASAELTLKFQFVAGMGTAATVPQPASVLLTIPSTIPGRPDLSFQANLQQGTQTAAVLVPDAIRGRSATVTLLPLPPADQTVPPYTFTVMIPLPGAPLQPLQLPANPSTISGQLQDALNKPKANYTARAFQNGILVSTAASTTASTTNQAGGFAIALPAGLGGNNTASNVTVQLTPDAGGADPWINLQPFPLSQASTDLGVITLPSYAAANAFQVTAHGDDAARTPAVGATIRAFTALPSDDVRLTAQFLRDAYTDGSGLANLSLIPGDSNVARPYVLSVVPAAGSTWASQCLADVDVLWHGTTGAPMLLQDVTLHPRPVVTGTMVSAGGTPVGNVVVTATSGAVAASSCLGAPTTTSVTTTSTGSFTLPLDPGTYTLDYDPPGGSSVPRMTVPAVDIPAIATMDLGPVQLPTPALVEGDVISATSGAVPNATVRIFEPACDMPAGCAMKPTLRAQTQTDANGHFRAVVAASPSN
jgi:hypothetical protein